MEMEAPFDGLLCLQIDLKPKADGFSRVSGYNLFTDRVNGAQLPKGAMKGVQHQKLSFFVIEFDPIGSHPTTGVKDTRFGVPRFTSDGERACISGCHRRKKDTTNHNF